MREETEYSASRLRFLAKVALIVGMIVGILLIILGIYKSVLYKNAQTNYFNSTSILEAMKITNFWMELIQGLAIVFSGYVSYIVFDACATIIENIDKTQVCKSIDRLTYAMLINKGKSESEKVLDEMSNNLKEEKDE